MKMRKAIQNAQKANEDSESSNGKAADLYNGKKIPDSIFHGQ